MCETTKSSYFRDRNKQLIMPDLLREKNFKKPED